MTIPDAPASLPHPSPSPGADHTFGQDVPRAGERRTRIVIALTAATMAVEIGAGLAYGSMALLADGLHMGSHASALVIAAFAYAYTRRHASDPRYSFGTGKVNSLAGFASAVLLAVFALAMAVESVRRLLDPVPIDFDHALLVAGIGLAVNAVSLLVLRGDGTGHGHARGEGTHEDHNLQAAYLHVLADALTSVLALAALVAGKYGGQGWMDPAMGLVGAALVTRWSVGLLRASSRVLLDHQAPPRVLQAVREAIEDGNGHRVADLHVWALGPGIYAAEIAIESSAPLSPDRYRERLPRDAGLVHVAIEVRPRRDGAQTPPVQD